MMSRCVLYASAAGGHRLSLCLKVEFEDHQLIKRRKASSGVEVLYVPMEKGALQQLLNDLMKV